MCTDIVESAITDCFLSYAFLPGASVEERKDQLSVRSGVPLPFFNGIPRASLGDDDAERRVRETLAYYRRRNTPFRWWITPASRPANLVEILKGNGFRHAYDAPGMAIDLDSIREQQPIPGFTIERVRSAEGLRPWAQVFGAAFSRPESEQAVWVAAFEPFGFADDAQWRHFVGFLDGQPVATTSMCIGREIGGVYHVATLPEARGRGIGAAVTLAGLQEARDAGCRAGALQSSEIAYGVYKSLGFRHCCDLTLYDWRPEYDE